jgi:transcriptional regulator with XRE-family HTH domain
VKGEIIKKLRTELGLTQEELAKKINVTKGTIGNLEINQRKGSREVEDKLCDFFGVSRDYLSGATTERKNDRKKMVSDFLEYLVESHVIKDANNIDKETEEMIMNMVKSEIALIKSKKR